MTYDPFSDDPQSQPPVKGQHNPYAAPYGVAGQNPAGLVPKNHVFAPGLILLILAAVWILLVLLSIPGQVIDWNRNPAPNDAEQAGRIVGQVVGWLMMASGSLIALIGGISMMRGTGYRTSMVAAIVCCIPCFTPCFLLGVPFGIWAIVGLNNPATKLFYQQRH